MGINSKHLIENQIPYHIRESNPLFTKFLEYYYEFVENSKIVDIIQEIRKYNDIDSVDEEFLMNFFEEFKSIPNTILMDRRLLAKHIYDLYQSKGTEKSLRLLFRILYGEEINVTYPYQNILRASDGRWVRESLITVSKISGNLVENSNMIQVINSRGSFSFRINRIERVGDFDRFFFESDKPYYIEDDQKIQVYSDTTLNYSGLIVPTISKLNIDDGGKYWQVGQIITLPGDIKDTIVQVKSVGPNGIVTKLDIIQYGHGYDNDQVFVVSPFKYKPDESFIDISSIIISDNPLARAHTINIDEGGAYLSENILGTTQDDYVQIDYVLNRYVEKIILKYSDGITGSNLIQRYVVPGYVSDFYVGQIVSPVVEGGSSIPNNEITVEQYYDSLLRIRINQSSNTTSAGYFYNYNGQLSFPEIRLQDNFFYQLFSYVIETSHLVSEYSNIISLVHPAGTKRFSTYSNLNEFKVTPTVSRTLSNDVVDLSEIPRVRDQIVLGNLKVLSDKSVPVHTQVWNNYDENNEIQFYDESIDWDVIGSGTTYDADGQFYDNGSYEDTDVQYTLEDDSIIVTKN